MEKDSITVENLLPNTEYQFRVRSVEAAAIGEPSIPSDWVRTAPGAPSETVDNLKWRSLDSQTLLVEWQPIEQGKESSGDNLRYRVSWSEATVGKNATDEILSQDDDHFENQLDIIPNWELLGDGGSIDKRVTADQINSLLKNAWLGR
uniref:Fibronectin type-III domain-containing protein n=1 Tax=Caenorhabditis tropicalis TaxID=1561998 RepID=A0A1I7TRZ2_9PELO